MPADRPFVDRPPGDLRVATRLAEIVARDADLPAPVLLHAGMNAIYRSGDLVLRVSNVNGPGASAYALADALAATGVRVARPADARPVVTDDESHLTLTAWMYVAPTGPVVDWHSVGEMVRRVRDLAPAEIPADYPVPPCTTYPWWHFDEILADVGGDIDDKARAGLERAVADHAGWVEASGGSEQWVVCHGDVHPSNVISGPDGPVIIDWDLLCVGPPGWDHAPLRSMIERWGARPEWYSAFANGYGRDLSDDPVTRSLTVLRLVAATLMRVKAARADRVAAAEAQRRLCYWRGEADAPTWRMS